MHGKKVFSAIKDGDSAEVGSPMKKIKDKKPVAYIIVEYSDERSGGEDKDDSAWPDRHDTHVDFRITNVMTEEVGKTRGCSTDYERIAIDFDPTNHQRVWVVTVIYEDGDTFGRSYGNGEIVGVYDTVEKATEVESKILKGAHTGSACWTGYFNSLQDVHVENFAIINQ